MASQRILYPEWRDYHEPTPYPFVDTATLRNDSGLFIPEGALLDATLYPVGSGAQLRLSKAVVLQQSLRLYVGDENSDELCYADLGLTESVDELRLQDVYGRPAGLLVSTAERLAVFQTWPTGVHEFTYEQTGFVADVCLPMPQTAVRGFLLDDGNVLAGDVWLVGDDGVVLSVAEAAPYQLGCFAEAGPTEQVVRVDVVGDPLFRRRLCSGAFTTPRFLRTITIRRDCRRIVCFPDEFGDFKITVGHAEAPDTILRIRNVDGGLRFEAVGEAQHR